MIELDGEANITKCCLFKISPIPSLKRKNKLENYYEDLKLSN